MENRNLNKIYLIDIKYSSHFLAFIYFIYTILGFVGIDCNLLGCFFHVSLFVLIQLIFTSFRFKYCYVHRLPLYYIGINELITNIDYYFKFQNNELELIIIHLILVFCLIFGYTFYYKKCKLK